MLSINTNIPSLIAQSSLKTSTQKLNTAIERMTTGCKINSAKDNAANYSISTNMTTKIYAYQVAEDNCAMGLDLIATASESLDLINDKLVRLRALAEQAANGTYGERSLQAINAEACAIVDEMVRSYVNTEYNGIKLFSDGEMSNPVIGEVDGEIDTSSLTSLSDISATQTLSSGTYSISTAQELAQLAQMTNSGKIGENVEFVLANDIDLSAYSSGEGWVPIGNSSNTFGAKFDGNGHVISNLYINRSAGDEQGLFGKTDGCTIKNLGVENVDVTGRGSTGGLAGYTSNSSIYNSYVVGNIDGDSGVGGLIGSTDDTSISNSYATGNVSGYDLYTGGLVGSSNGSVTNCYAIGNVSGDSGVGGLIGNSTDGSSVTRSYATGNVSGSSPVGGLIGNSTNTNVSDSYYNAETSGQNDTGNGVGVTTSELKNMIKSGALLGNETFSNTVAFQVGISSSDSSQISLETSFALNTSSLRNIGLDNSNYLGKIDKLTDLVSAKQIEFGAAQNRLESALDEISTQYENLVSSRSTLRDADISEVSSEYIRQQILQQASASLLSTANQTPALALQLI